MDRLIQLQGTIPLEGLYFRSASIQEAMSSHSHASVVLESDDPNLLPEDFLGKTINLGFETQGGLFAELSSETMRYFDAVVTGMGVSSHQAGNRCQYRFVLNSWTWMLSKNRDFRVYQNETVPDIVRQVIARQSHSAVHFEDRSQRSYSPWEYCVQYGESDYAFISRLMQQEGLYFYFEHTATSHTLVMTDSNALHSPFPGYESVPYNPAGQSARLTDEQVIASLTQFKTIETPRFAHADYNFKIPATRLLAASAADVKPFHEALEVFEYPGEFESASEADQYARARQEALLARQLVFQGDTNARGIAAGRIFTPSCDDLPHLSIGMLVISSSLHIVEAAPEAHDQTQSDFHCSFQSIPLSQPFRVERAAVKPLVKGPLPALVVGPAGDEIYTDTFGRVKVQFYWDRYGRNDEHSSCWIRVAYPVAGKGWGFVAIPRIGQEVVVSFEDGDPDRPVITGAIHNADQTINYALPDQKTVSGWRTHSTLNGADNNFNELRFEDKKGEEYVWFQAEKDYFGLVKHDSREEIGQDVHRVIKRDRFEEIQRNYSQTVVGVFRQQVNQLHTTVEEDFLARVKGALSVINDGHVSVRSAGDISVRSDATTHLKSAADIKLDAGAEGHFKAGSSLTISAGSSITLAVGGSSITISAGGVSFSGPSIGVNSGGGGGSASAASPTAPDSAQLPDEPVPPVDPLV